jgi:hypothetical protein
MPAQVGCSVNLIRTLDAVGTVESSSTTAGTLSASSVAGAGSSGIVASLSTLSNSLSTLDISEAATTITLMSSRPFPFGVVVGGGIGGVVLLTCIGVLAYYGGRYRATKGNQQLRGLAMASEYGKVNTDTCTLLYNVLDVRLTAAVLDGRTSLVVGFDDVRTAAMAPQR